MARHKYKRTGHHPQSRELAMMKSACSVLAVTLVASCILVLVSSAVVCSQRDPVSAVDIAAWISLGIASLIGGVAARFVCSEDAERTALVSGCLFVLVLLVLALISDGISSILWMAIGYGLSVFLHLIGAKLAGCIFSTRKRKRKNY